VTIIAIAKKVEIKKIKTNKKALKKRTI